MKFSIIATSDIHGHTERFSQLASMINSRQPDLLIDNGDFLQGSHLSYFYENIKHVRATGAHDYAMFHKNPVYETSDYVPNLMMAYIPKNSPLQTQVKNISE